MKVDVLVSEINDPLLEGWRAEAGAEWFSLREGRDNR